MTDPRKVQNVARRVTFVLGLLGVLYLTWRFQFFRLPAANCSPVMRFSPGAVLVIDDHPLSYDVGDAVFFAGDDGRVYLAVIESEGEIGYILVADNPDCPGEDSSRFGELREGALRGRVILSFGI